MDRSLRTNAVAAVAAGPCTCVAALALLVSVAGAAPGPALGAAPAGPPPASAAVCAAAPDSAAPPESATYYSIDLVPTRRVPGTAYIDGVADVTFQPSPFVVSVTPDGSYEYDVHVRLPELGSPRSGGYVAWVTTTEIDEIRRIGPVENGRATGRVGWNKFLVVVTLEADSETPTDRWTGPIAFRGMSRSGMMHTMAGHGPFQEEKCAAYGYD